MRPTPISQDVSGIREQLLYPEPQEHTCRSCRTLFTTSARSMHNCSRCLRLIHTKHSHATAIEPYSVPKQFLGYSVAPQLLKQAQSAPLLLLEGPTGTGKTSQAHHLLASLTSSAKQAAFVQAGQLGKMSFDAKLPYDVKALVIDDIGRRMTDGICEALCSLIDHRASKQMHTIFTTNVKQDDWQEIDSRLASRLKMFQLVHLGGPDRRGTA